MHLIFGPCCCWQYWPGFDLNNNLHYYYYADTRSKLVWYWHCFGSLCIERLNIVFNTLISVRHIWPVIHVVDHPTSPTSNSIFALTLWLWYLQLIFLWSSSCFIIFSFHLAMLLLCIEPRAGTHVIYLNQLCDESTYSPLTAFCLIIFAKLSPWLNMASQQWKRVVLQQIMQACLPFPHHFHPSTISTPISTSIQIASISTSISTSF